MKIIDRLIISALTVGVWVLVLGQLGSCAGVDEISADDVADLDVFVLDLVEHNCSVIWLSSVEYDFKCR